MHTRCYPCAMCLRIFVNLLILSTSLHAQDFSVAVKSLLEKSPDAVAVTGADPAWRFLSSELRHMQIPNDASAAAFEAIVKYRDELQALGVDLLVVPVPAKAAIYPERLVAGASVDSVRSLAAFYKSLAEKKVDVLDLETAFRDAKKSAPETLLYCATDSHWSPQGAELAARLVAARFKERKDLFEFQLRDLIKLKPSDIEFHGDLLTDPEKSTLPKEKLPLTRAGSAANPNGTEVSALDSDTNAPLLVMGDSHCQVFRAGGAMHATCGGFIDHLGVDLSLPVEEVSTQASGGDGPRVEIARRTVREPEFWAKKKIVVWLFSARELTAGEWRSIPARVVRKG